MIQTLSEHDIPPTQIAQLSGHKNLKSIENYSSVSTKQQMHMSKVLSSVTAGTTSLSSSETAIPGPSTCDSQNTGKQAMALFSGAVIQGDGPALRTRRRSSTQDPHPKVATGVRADASAAYAEPDRKRTKLTAEPTDGPAQRTRRHSSTHDPRPTVTTGVRE
ncbi:hypothetical protein OS493_036189, partial [Desmophyllum pertusum]